MCLKLRIQIEGCFETWARVLNWYAFDLIGCGGGDGGDVGPIGAGSKLLSRPQNQFYVVHAEQMTLDCRLK